MKSQLQILRIVIIILIGFVTLPPAFGGEICDYLTKDIGLSIGTTIPSNIPYKNEVFNVYSGQGTIEGTFSIVNGIVTEYECGALSEKNTYDIFVKDKKTVENLEKAENKVDAFNNALGDSIEIKGKFIGKKIKIFFTGTALSIASWFS